MPDKFDPYREALVVETQTIWPLEYDDLADDRRWSIEQKLHADPASASHLEYERIHTGFCRVIHVTDADVSRIT